MIVLGIETSCDECSLALVADGRAILGQVVAGQQVIHAPHSGVVPELASRAHVEWIMPIWRRVLAEANVDTHQVDAVAVTNRPGLSGSLIVGVSFAKALAWSLGRPCVGVDHIRAHLYACQLEQPVAVPFIGLIVSGGHTIISLVRDWERMEMLGGTLDDACGEAFDKVACHLNLGYPGGAELDRLAQRGDSRAAVFPHRALSGARRRYHLSYSGLKTAVIHQLDSFWNDAYPRTAENIAAAFQRAAIDMLVERLLCACRDSGVTTVVVGGGVAANSYLRRALRTQSGIKVYIPAPALCTDNGAMIAGLGYQLLVRGISDSLDMDVSSRAAEYRLYNARGVA